MFGNDIFARILCATLTKSDCLVCELIFGIKVVHSFEFLEKIREEESPS